MTKYKDADSTKDEYRKRQMQSLHDTRLSPEVYAQVEAHAEHNSMSVSEVIRDAMGAFNNREHPVGRRRRSRRVTFWASPDEYAEFMAKVRSEDLTVARAIEVGLEDVL